MTLITLNIWGGSLRKELLQFFWEHKAVDIFCLQEVYYNAAKRISTDDTPVSLDILTDIAQLLPDHKVIFYPVVGEHYGLALLVRKTISINEHNAIKIYNNPTYKGSGPAHSRWLQVAELEIDNQLITIANVHGLWNGQGKGDSPDRLVQSENIVHYLNNINHPVILCGDLNLRPDTKSLQLINQNLRQLNTEYNIRSTRTHWYPKKEPFADYIFISSSVIVNTCYALEEVVSDHKALWVDCHLEKADQEIPFENHQDSFINF